MCVYTGSARRTGAGVPRLREVTAPLVKNASSTPKTAAKAPAARKSAAKKVPATRTARVVRTAKVGAKAAKPAKGSKAVTTGKPVKAAKTVKVARPAVDGRAEVAAKPARHGNKLPPTTAALRKQVIAALDELKARDVKEIDIREKASFTDLLVIASGTSTRHVKSIADEVVKFSKRAGVMPLGVEGQKEAEWVLVDLGDIVVHVMLPRIREFYALERLWLVGDEQAPADALAG
jgi:ribosome-associated protein